MTYIRSFDGLRAVSILFVLLNHLGISFLLPHSNFFQQRVWLLFAGGTGVNIFFVLSGFLITGILLKELKETGTISLGRFYIRRALRLLPALVLFYTFIAALMLSGAIRSSSAGFFYSFFYVYNFVPKALLLPELIHTWSLAVEEQFYFTWPFILLLFKSGKAIYWGALLLSLCIAAPFIFPHIKIPAGSGSVALTEIYRPETWFIPAVAPIMIGSITSIVVSSRQSIVESIRNNQRFCVFLSGMLYLSPLYLASPLSTYFAFVQSLGIALLLAVLFINRDTILGRLLSVKPLVYIGKISYGIYVFQGLFLRNGPGGKLFIQQFPQNLVFTMLCAMISYHFIERSILEFKRKFQ